MAILLVYAQTLSFDFVGYDDFEYIVDNPMVTSGFSADGLRWAVFQLEMRDAYAIVTSWHPLTWLSHMLDVEIFGVEPAGPHAVNLLLHVLNTWILFGMLRSATGALLPSAFAAGLFALHPIHVESVAWISERKGLLSTFFGFLALAAYGRYARKREMRWYVVSLGAAATSLLAKPMFVTLPALLLLLDVWPLRRLTVSAGRNGTETCSARTVTLARAAIEKLPFAVLSLGFAAITMTAQRSARGSGTTLQLLTAGILNAVVSYSAYLRKLVWPGDLSPLYAHPFAPSVGGVPPTATAILASAFFLLAVTSLVFRERGRPYLWVGWSFYAITMLPVIGLVQVGTQGMADRYTYVPFVGLYCALTFWIADLSAGLGQRARRAVGIAGTMLLVAFGFASARQAAHWRDSLSLYSRAVAVEPRNSVMQYNLANALRTSGDLAAAEAHYEAALAVHPTKLDAIVNLGAVLAEQGRAEAAVARYREALALRPDVAMIHYNLGNLLAAGGDRTSAEHHFREALRLAPDHHKAAQALERLEAPAHPRSAVAPVDVSD